MSRTRVTPHSYSATERRNVANFFSYAVKWAGTQPKLAEMTGLAQATINGIMNLKAGFGHRSLLEIARVTGVTVEDILSGAGLARLRGRGTTAAEGVVQQHRTRAARALAELFGLPLSEALALLDSLGLVLPAEVPATVWFDAGRAALERRAIGDATARRIK